MNIEAPKQGLTAFKQLLKGVQKQALAEAARAGEEVILAGAGQCEGMIGLVHIGIAFLNDFAEGLDADGELGEGQGHGVRVASR